MKTVLIMSIGLLPILACAPTVAPEAAAPDIGAPPSDLGLQGLRERSADYAAIFAQAQRAGLVSGAVRGAVLGALVEGETGLIIGAVFGAALGSTLGGVAAERLVAEHQEFLTRQEIIANILAAAQAATVRSREDAMIVRQAVAAEGAGPQPVPDWDLRVADLHYRDVLEWAVGRNAAAGWETNEGGNGPVTRVWTDPLPTAEVERVAPNEDAVTCHWSFIQL
jgi:hypothetical protein